MTNTTNYKFELIDFDTSPWHDRDHNNWRLLDGLLYNLIALANVQGIWANSIAYVVGDRVVDGADSSLWECKVTHTSAASPVTFATDRSNNPTYWAQVGAAAFQKEGDRAARRARQFAGHALAAYQQVIQERVAAEAAVNQAVADAQLYANSARAVAVAEAELARQRAKRSAAAAAVSETNAATYAQLNTTSTSSVAIGTGSKTFVTADERAFVVGQFVQVARTSAPTASYMWGQVISWTVGTKTLILDVQVTQGSGTFSDWTISGTGAQGADGSITGVESETTNYTLVIGDVNKYKRLSHATGINCIVPNNASVAFNVGTQVHVAQSGAGQVTFVEDTSVTINKPASQLLKTKEQYSMATLVKVGTDEWDLIGDLEAAP